MTGDTRDINDRLARLSPGRRRLLEQLLAERSGRSPDGGGIPSRRGPGPYPLSSTQRRLWFLDRFAPGSAGFNVWQALRLTGEISVPALEQALADVCQRHETLRTIFDEIDGEPVQRVVESPGECLTIVPVGPRGEGGALEEVRRLASAEAGRPFDLRGEVPFRAVLYQSGREEAVLLLVMHHINSDAWSRRILARDIGRAYSARLSGREPLPLHYIDYTLWQNERLEGEDVRAQLAWWYRELEGSGDPLDLPTDHLRPPVLSDRGSEVRIALPPDTVGSLKELVQAEGATPFMGLAAAWAALLHRYCAQEELCLGFPVAGRLRPELEDQIGFYANTLVLRVDFRAEPGFRELLGQIREKTLGALANQEVPFDRVVEEIQPERDPSHSPLYQAAITYQDIPVVEPCFAGCGVEELDIEPQVASLELYLAVKSTAAGFDCRLRFNTDLFAPESMQRYLERLCRLIENGGADPDRPTGRLSLFLPGEKELLLETFNDTRREYPRESSLPREFRRIAAQHPERQAVTAVDGSLSYRELDRVSDRIADRLAQAGVGRGAVVAIGAGRTAGTIAALLGVLKRGAAYFPLDPDDPEARVRFMLEDAGAHVLLRHDRSSGEPAGLDITYLDAGRPAAGTGREGAGSRCDPEPDDPAYIMYTSGSTGTPKGVVVTHRNILRLVWGTDYFDPGAEQTFLHLAPLAFDASTFEIWAPLMHGHRCVVSPDQIPSASELGTMIRDEGITVLFLTTTYFNALIDESPETLQGPATISIGGEALSPDHIQRALEHLPEAVLKNGYGPTETTTFGTTWTITRRDWTGARSIPIGRPLANSTAHILDRAGQLCPIGIPGELCLGGDGVALGYVHRPELTAERFIPDPFSSEPEARLYRTGDLCRWLESGDIEYIGRMDEQIKIRGHRIEPGEVENVLRRHPDVQDVATAVRTGPGGGLRLEAFFVPEPGTALSAPVLGEWLRERLPAWMVPAAMTPIDAVPLTPRGKLDRRALPASRPLEHDRERAQWRPGTTLELQLITIWEEVLDTSPVAPDDDFFDLGGHSLLALKLFNRIEQQIGPKLPLATLFTAPTVAALAGVIERSDWEAIWSSLVPISRRGEGRPFFCVHGLQGNVVGQVGVARSFRSQRPYYGLQAVGLSGDDPPFNTIEEMAAHYLEEIRSVQPRGPYFVGGLCFGGLVALEMARILAEEGTEPGRLVLIDPPPPRVHYLGATALLRTLGSSLVPKLRHTLLRRYRTTPENPAMTDLGRHHLALRKTYRPRRIRVPTLLITSRYYGPHREPDRGRLWRFRLLCGMEIEHCRMPGSHDQLLEEPLVGEVAGLIRDYLRADVHR